MKQCSSCAGEVHDQDTACDQCGNSLNPDAPHAWADEEVARHAAPSTDGATTPAAMPADAPVLTPTPAPPQVQHSARGLNRTELVIVALSIVAGGVVTFGVLMARGAAPRAASAEVRIAAAGTVPAAAPALPASSAPKWTDANRARWVGNPRRDVAFELPAEHKVQAWMTQVEPVLVVRCAGRRTEAFVYTSTPAKIEPQDEDHTVGIAFDTEPQAAERWQDSAEHDALFAPDGEAFARRLMSAGTLRFGFTPHNAPPVTVHFNVAGLRELLGPASRQCGWKK